ncbi:hypothetical protein FB451DRAFT_1520166 [Mycena latifolia]|nr:hypothetical protein FB451DRAFT_1520166 [Mycena latifolia]
MATSKLRTNLRLPQELIEAIVYEFDDKSPCLTTCSKTAKTFRVPCQRRIFRALVLHSEETGFSNTFRRAFDLFEVSPHLTVYVRNLKTPLPTVEKETRYLERILRALHNLERFMISNRGESINWSPTPSSLASAVFRTISLPSLDRLHLVNIFNLPCSLVYLAASATRVLSLDSVRIRTLAADTPSVPSTLQLEHLILSSRSLADASHFLRNLTREGYLQRLRRLSLKLETFPYENYLLIFAPLSRVIQHLEIDFSTCRELINIPRFELLQVLELSFYIGMSRHLPNNLGPIVSALPETAPLLERLTLILGVMPCIPEIPWTIDGPYPTFDTGFMERRDLSRLRNVTCCLHLMMDYFHGDQDVSYNEFVPAMEGKLPGLRGTDMLTFTRRSSSYRYQDHLP